MISPPGLASGEKILMTCVGEPDKPSIISSASISLAVHVAIWAFLALSVPLIDGILGSPTSLTTVMRAGRDERMTS